MSAAARGAAEAGRCARRLIGVSCFVLSVASTMLPPSAAASDDDLRVTLERTACFGTCPIYSVSVDASGAITYAGDRFVAERGPRTAKLDADDMRRLVEAIGNAGLDDLEGPYVRGAPGCEDYSTDNPTQIITVVRGGHEKRIVYDFGCKAFGVRDTFARLKSLGASIDAILDTARWVGPAGNE